MAEKKGFCIKPFLQIKKFQSCFFEYRMRGQFPRAFRIWQSLKKFFRFCSIFFFKEILQLKFKPRVQHFCKYELVKNTISYTRWSKEAFTNSMKNASWSFKNFKRLYLYLLKKKFYSLRLICLITAVSACNRIIISGYSCIKLLAPTFTCYQLAP